MVAWTGGIALPAFGTLHVPDVIDGGTLLGIPHPVTQVEPVRPPAGDGHCAICHLQRATRSAVLMAGGALASIEPASHEHVATECALASASLYALPSRGPPTIVLSQLI